MKITKTPVEKIQITEVEALDPVNIICEDFGPGQGKISIECCGECWSYYWGCMGDQYIIKTFFLSADNYYLSGKLAPQTKSMMTNEDGLEDHLKKSIIEQRMEREISSDRARELWEDIPYGMDGVYGNEDMLSEVLGDEWYYCLPEVPNPAYEYLSRIVDAVKAALKEGGE